MNPVTQEIVAAFRLNLRSSNTFQMSRRPMDRLYGPQARQTRHALVEALLGQPVPKSHKAIGWNAFRQLLIEFFEPVGQCIAEVNQSLDEQINDLITDPA